MSEYDYLMAIKKIEDKETYDKFYSAHQFSKNTRTGVKNKATSVLSDFTKVRDGIKAYESELIAVITPYERHFETLRKEWEDSEKERKAAEAQAKVQKLEDRMTELKEKGLLFNSESSMFEIGSVNLTKMDVEKLSDKGFEKLCVQVVEQKAAVDKVKAELAAAEAERERLAEEERVKEQARIKAQEEQNKSLQEQVLNMRNMVLSAKGLVLNGTLYSYKDKVILKQSQVLDINDAQFMELIVDIDKSIQDHDASLELAVENERKREVRTSNIDFFISLGYLLDGVHNKMVYKTAIRTITLDSEEFETDQPINQDVKDKFSEEISILKKEVEQKMADDAKALLAKEAADAAAAEKERLSKLGDKELWDDYISRLKQVETPDFKTQDFKDRLFALELQLC